MSISACILLVSLLGLIGQSACNFPRVEDTFELASTDFEFLSRARKGIYPALHSFWKHHNQYFQASY
jgi:hypothetical protein